ncbi:unnamed protein product [Mytilus coruscus]|uniref:Uncharacterized protein n=1 Tax=Mytilus coruscus TaxID=42192 RepID=A0A6J8CNS4_MYTCO|nr:unnamed protein product [Mytilus coruscus]
MPNTPPITDIDPTSGVPYATLVDQMLKTDSPSNPTSGVPDPTTPTERSDILIPPSKMLMSLPGQGQSVMAVPHAQTITSNMKHGEHFITVPMSVKETTAEERVDIPVHLLQQEIQKQAQQTQQPDELQARMIATHPESKCLSPVPLQLNKSITSIAGALMSLPSTKPSSPSVLTGIPSPIHQSQPVSTTSMGPGLAQEPQAISEMTIANKSTLAIPSTSTHLENSRGMLVLEYNILTNLFISRQVAQEAVNKDTLKRGVLSSKIDMNKRMASSNHNMDRYQDFFLENEKDSEEENTPTPRKIWRKAPQPPKGSSSAAMPQLRADG